MDTWGSGGTGVQVGLLQTVIGVETLQENYSPLPLNMRRADFADDFTDHSYTRNFYYIPCFQSSYFSFEAFQSNYQSFLITLL